MIVYCGHQQKTFTKQSNYYMCRVCTAGWYGKDTVPLVILGFTDERDVVVYNTYKRNYSTERCAMCHDVIVNAHGWCNFKINLQKKWKRLWQKRVQHS